MRFKSCLLHSILEPSIHTHIVQYWNAFNIRFLGSHSNKEVFPIKMNHLCSTCYLVPRLELLAGTGHHLHPAALVAELGGPQLVLGEAAAPHHHRPAAPHQGEQAGRPGALLLARQLLQSLRNFDDVLVVLLNLILWKLIIR